MAANNATMTSLEAQKQQRLAVVKTVAENAHAFLRVLTLHQLARDRENLALGWAILFIFFVFLAVETAPVLTKVMSGYGPYDTAAGTDGNGSLAPGGPAAPRCSGENTAQPNTESYGECDAQCRAQQLHVVMQNLQMIHSFSKHKWH